MGLDKEDIKQLIAILQKGLIDDTQNEESETNKKTKHRNNSKKKTKESQNSTNKFLEMGLMNAHKDDTAIDKLLRKHPPTPRRSKIKILNVVCRVCGKKESINPSLLNESPDRYKCNKCCTSPG